MTGAVRYVDPDGNVLLPARLVGAVAAATFDFTAHGGKALKTANTTSANKAINNAREQAHLEGRGLSSEEAKSIASNQRQKNNRIRKVTSDAKKVIKSGVSQYRRWLLQLRNIMTKKKKANKDKKTNKKEKRSLLEILFYAWVFIFFHIFLIHLQ